MAILRDLCRLYIFEPLIRWRLWSLHKARVRMSNGHANGALNGNANGKRNGDTSHMTHREKKDFRHSVTRFAEQGWQAVYYTTSFSYGFCVHMNLPQAPFNPQALWIGYPHVLLAGPIKLYYIVQTAFYFHQILILNAEARRKDHFQMMSHHIITIALLVTSYFYNFTRVGCLVLLLMDLCDVIFPFAKMLRYSQFPMLCDTVFGLWMVSWFVTRHLLFIWVMWSAYAEAPQLIPFDWIPEREYWLTEPVYYVFLSLLVALQCLQIFWFTIIIQVAYRVVNGQGADDTRSDDEDDDATDDPDGKKDQ